MDPLLDEAIPENHLRARLDKLDRGVVEARRRGIEALRPLPRVLQVESQQTECKCWPSLCGVSR
jgi:hypothetical protein